MTVERVASERVHAAGSQAVQGARRGANHITLPVAWRLGLGDFVLQTIRQASRDKLPVYAGNVAYRGLFAVLPSLIALFWLLTALHAGRLIAALQDLIGTAMPEPAGRPIQDQLANIPSDRAGGALTFGALVALAVALIAIAGGFRAAMEAMNAIEQVEEGRPLWKQYAVALALGLAVTGLLVAALFLVVFGSALATTIADGTGLNGVARFGWSLVTWPALTALILAACALIYYFAPDTQQHVRWVSMGAILATALWLLFTVLYSIYVDRFANYQETYGALAGIALLMAYIYGSSFILLLGAVMNQVIEQSAPAGENAGT